jgi:hypothetical protein
MISSLLFQLTNFAAVTSNCDPNKDNPNNSFFGFPHWWRYISTGQKDIFGHCTPAIDFPNGIWAIALAIVDMLLYLAGIVAIVSIIVAGIMYLNTRGDVQKAVSARNRLVNSLVGLAIVATAIALVTFLGDKLV